VSQNLRNSAKQAELHCVASAAEFATAVPVIERSISVATSANSLLGPIKL
jgi:hypothetical protein